MNCLIFFNMSLQFNLTLKCHFFIKKHFVSLLYGVVVKWREKIKFISFFRISDRFRIRTGKFRFHIGGGFDNRHVASQRHPWHSCQGLPIYWNVAEYWWTDTRYISLGCCSWSILHSIAINSEGNFFYTFDKFWEKKQLNH